ncbi:MAG: hypothetical protein ACWGIK_00650 [Achromobacter pulmonis]
MTQQDDITQPVLTDADILRAVINASDSLNITRVHESGGPSRTIMEDAGLLELGRAIEAALLSKLRAPVADERADDILTQVYDRFGIGVLVRNPSTLMACLGNVIRRANCLSQVEQVLSVPTPPEPEDDGVWGEESLLRWGADEKGYAEHFKTALAEWWRRTAGLTLASAPVADERTACPTDVCQAGRADGVLCANDECDRASGVRPASAPVAGEAYQGDSVAERLDNMADDQHPGSQAQSDLYAAATHWRKHIAHRTAPQASAESVDLPGIDADRLRTIAGSGSQTAMTNALLNVARALKQPQADKDGGQQRAGDSVDLEAAAKTMAECMDYPWAHMPREGRAAMRQHAQSVIRAALSATQPEQGERDADRNVC